MCSHFMQRVNHEAHNQAINVIYSMEPRPGWEQSIRIIRDQKNREETRLLEYSSTMSGERKPKVGLITQTYGGANDIKPSRPCRWCGGSHWDKDCSKKKTSTPSRPCSHCGGEHYDDKCPSLKTAMVAAKTKYGGPIVCHACGERHKVIDCPVVKLAKESLTGKRCDKVSREDVEDTEDILQLTKTLAKLSKVHGSKSMAAITQFAEANAGITPQKKSYQTIVHARVPTMSIGLMCTTSATNGMVLLDSCSQEHIIKDKELMENMSDCQSEIYLYGIVDSSNVVKSMGCGTALGLEAYYVPGASSNLISYAKLLTTGHMY